MRLRCPTPMPLLGLLLALCLGMQPRLAHGVALNPNASPATATYRLTSSTSLPTPDSDIQGPQVVAMILPAGSVVPPKKDDKTEGSPLTVLPDSHGFDPSHLVVALKDGTSSTGQPEQLFGLIFFGGGLQPDGVLHFALSIDSALANNPPQLQPLTPGISIVADSTTSGQGSGSGTNSGSGGSGTPSTDGQNVPEPLPIVLWSAVALGLAARRHLSRQRRHAA